MNTTTPQLYDYIKKFVLKQVKNPQDAEDIVQDVFIKAQLKSGQLKDEGKFTAWLFSVTRNSIMDYHRSRKKILEPEALTSTEEYNEFNDCVATCLNRYMSALPSPYREALELTEKENLPQKELATRLGISYSGAKSRVQRARQMLKDKINSLSNIKTDGYGNVLVCEDRVPCDCYSFQLSSEMHKVNLTS